MCVMTFIQFFSCFKKVATSNNIHFCIKVFDYSFSIEFCFFNFSLASSMDCHFSVKKFEFSMKIRATSSVAFDLFH